MDAGGGAKHKGFSFHSLFPPTLSLCALCKCVLEFKTVQVCFYCFFVIVIIDYFCSRDIFFLLIT